MLLLKENTNWDTKDDQMCAVITKALAFIKCYSSYASHLKALAHICLLSDYNFNQNEMCSSVIEAVPMWCSFFFFFNEEI